MHEYNGYYENIFPFFIQYIKMNQKNINFNNKKMKKTELYKNKKNI